VTRSSRKETTRCATPYRYRQIIERAAEQERITGTERKFSEEDRRIMEALGYAGGEQDPEQDGTDGSD
jgi:hypothetical protein